LLNELTISAVDKNGTNSDHAELITETKHAHNERK